MKAENNTYITIWLKAFLLLALFIGAYWVPLKGIVSIWWTDDDYSYGFLIPLISAYLVWDKRSTLQDLQLKSAWSMLPALVLLTLLSLYGILGSSGNISKTCGRHPSTPVSAWHTSTA